MKQKFYAVRKGKVPGVYETWDECKAQVDGIKGAVYKSFSTKNDALAFIDQTKDDDLSGPYAFVDGSFNSETGVYGYGGFLCVDGQKWPVTGCDNDVEMSSMRNVAGEICGAMAVIRKAEEMHLRELTLLYDYKGIEEWACGRWRAKKDGTALYAEFMKPENRSVNIKFQHVDAHTGIEGNEIADAMAKNAVGIALSEKQRSLLKGYDVMVDKKQIPDKVRIFEICAHDKSWENCPLRMSIDASNNPEQTIGEAMGYCVAKYPDLIVSVSSDFNAGFSQYEMVNGVFKSNDIGYKIDEDINAVKLSQYAYKTASDIEHIQTHKPVNIRDILYEKPEREGSLYQFYVTGYHSDRELMRIENRIPEMAKSDNICFTDRTYDMLQYVERVENHADVLHYMPDEFRPHVLSVDEDLTSYGAFYKMKVQIGDDIVDHQVGYDRQVVQEYGRPSDAEIASKIWLSYVSDKAASEMDDFWRKRQDVYGNKQRRLPEGGEDILNNMENTIECEVNI